MKLAAEHPREITEDELSKENGWKGRMLYSLLVVLVSGRALGIVRQVPEGHGLEAWRCLAKEYEPAVATRYCAVLAALLTPVWTETGGFMEQLVEWGRRLRQYEAMAGEKLSDALKCAVVTARAPNRVKDFLRLSSTGLTGNYGQLREAIRNFLAKGRVYAVDGTGVGAMEVGAVLPFKGGGKGGKGGGKAKSLSQQRPGQERRRPQSQGPRGGCFGCGGAHRQADCPQRRGPQQQQRMQQQQQHWSGGQRQQQQQQRGPRRYCFGCGGPHRQQDCPRRRQGGGGQGLPRRRQQPQQQQNRQRQNPDANMQCRKCGMWWHRFSACPVVGELQDPQEQDCEQEQPELIGGVEKPGDEEPLIYMIEEILVKMEVKSDELEKIYVEPDEKSAKKYVLEKGVEKYVLGPYRELCLSVDEGEWLHVGELRQLMREGWRVEHVDAAEAYVQGGAAPRMEATGEKPGKSERQGLPESDAGMSVGQGLPKPDPSGIAVTTPPVSVTKPPGRAVGANEPGEIPAEIQTDGEEWHMWGR